MFIICFIIRFIICIAYIYFINNLNRFRFKIRGSTILSQSFPSCRISAILFAILYYIRIIEIRDISFPFSFRQRTFKEIYITTITLGGSSCQLVEGTSLLHIITFSRADTSATSNLKFGELLQMLNSPKAPLELL